MRKLFLILFLIIFCGSFLLAQASEKREIGNVGRIQVFLKDPDEKDAKDFEETGVIFLKIGSVSGADGYEVYSLGRKYSFNYSPEISRENGWKIQNSEDRKVAVLMPQKEDPQNFSFTAKAFKKLENGEIIKSDGFANVVNGEEDVIYHFDLAELDVGVENKNDSIAISSPVEDFLFATFFIEPSAKRKTIVVDKLFLQSCGGVVYEKLKNLRMISGSEVATGEVLATSEGWDPENEFRAEFNFVDPIKIEEGEKFRFSILADVDSEVSDLEDEKPFTLSFGKKEDFDVSWLENPEAKIDFLNKFPVSSPKIFLGKNPDEGDLDEEIVCKKRESKEIETFKLQRERWENLISDLRNEDGKRDEDREMREYDYENYSFSIRIFESETGEIPIEEKAKIFVKDGEASAVVFDEAGVIYFDDLPDDKYRRFIANSFKKYSDFGLISRRLESQARSAGTAGIKKVEFDSKDYFPTKFESEMDKNGKIKKFSFEVSDVVREFEDPLLYGEIKKFEEIDVPEKINLETVFGLPEVIEKENSDEQNLDEVESREEKIKKVILKDVENYSYGDAIKFLVDRGVVAGNPDGNFYPEKNLNRAELTKIVLLSGKYAEEIDEESEREKYAKNCFSDVSTNDWFAPFVCFAKENEIVGGYPDGKFRPERPVSFAEAMKIAALAFGEEIEISEGEKWYRVFAEKFENMIPPEIKSFNQPLSRGLLSQILAVRIDPEILRSQLCHVGADTCNAYEKIFSESEVDKIFDDIETPAKEDKNSEEQQKNSGEVTLRVRPRFQ